MSKEEPKYENAVYSYPYQGSQWSFEIPATSLEDAESRLHAIQNYGKLDGWPAYSVPYSLGWFAKAFVAWKNWRRQP